MRLTSWQTSHPTQSLQTGTLPLPISILVVDDDRAMARAVEMILLARGYHVKVAHAASDALEHLADGELDLLLLDIMLPDIDGYELLTSLQERRAVNLDSVIMMSALASNADLERAREAGICSYLQKPFTSNQLIAAVDECLASRYNPRLNQD